MEEEFVCDSNEAMDIKLVRSPEDLEDNSTSFKPEMTHQIFGDNENIFGYKDLQVQLYYSACRLSMFLGMKYSSKFDNDDLLQADNVLQVLQKELQIPHVITNISDFVKTLKDEESFIPHGEKTTAFTIEKDDTSKQYEIYYCDSTNLKFINFYERLQTFILFYIDAANYIDVDDPKWQFFVAYEKFKNNCGNYCYAAVGFCTVYEYYAYPDRIRPRVSQMLVLPPFRGCGLGVRLLGAVYHHYRGSSLVVDITVEDPNEEFQRLRDYLNASLCVTLPAYSPEQLKMGFSHAMVTEACSKYKISKKQARRAYEILRLKHTNVFNELEMKQYRLDVKKRLNAPFHKEAKLKTKLKPLIEKDPQLVITLGLTSPEQRYLTLQQMFSETRTVYESILRRMDVHPLPFQLF